MSSAAKDMNGTVGFLDKNLKYVDLRELSKSSPELCAIKSLKSSLQFPFPAFIVIKLTVPFLLIETLSCIITNIKITVHSLHCISTMLSRNDVYYKKNNKMGIIAGQLLFNFDQRMTATKIYNKELLALKMQTSHKSQ